MASHERALQETRRRPGFPAVDTSLNNDLIWGTAATKNAISWQHLDDDGMATLIDLKSGEKVWIMGRRRRDNGSLGAGDITSINAFSKDWDPIGSCRDIFEHEAVLLRPGCLL